MKLHLPDVTLVQIETREHVLARMAVEDCLRHASFGDCLIFTDRPAHFQGLGRIIEVPDWPDKLGWSRFSWFGLPPHVRTSHCLTIQWDSWIWRPEMWSDEFLEYDIVGAPWWYEDRNVGNLGFGLRSQRLIRYVREHRARYPCNTNVDDDLLCRGYRPQLEQAGFRWAPERLAHQFAFECARPAPNSQHFGFHAMFNWKEVLSPRELKDRTRIAFRSKYIRGGYMWKAFKDSSREIIAELEAEEH